MLVEQFICGNDNLGVLIHDEMTGKTASIDAPNATIIHEQLVRFGWQLDAIFITHHHQDHIVGVEELRALTGAVIYAPKIDNLRFMPTDKILVDGEVFQFGRYFIKALATPGHTLDSMCFYCPQPKLIFTGDTLFSLGCGRFFEGTPMMMLQSLKKLRSLPDDIQIYCGHEYTLDNASFAYTLDPDNRDLQNRYDQVAYLRQHNLSTMPSTVGLEKRTNPFLRWDDQVIRHHLMMEDAEDWEVLAEIRKRKDEF